MTWLRTLVLTVALLVALIPLVVMAATCLVDLELRRAR